MRQINLDAMGQLEKGVYLYLGIGGILSFCYAVGALLTTPLLRAALMIYKQGAYRMLGHWVGSAWHIVLHAIMRVFLWAPDFLTSVLSGKISLFVWLFGMNALQP